MLAVLFFILAESMLAGSLLPHSLSNKFHSNERTNSPNPNSLSPENGSLQCVDCNATVSVPFSWVMLHAVFQPKLHLCIVCFADNFMSQDDC
jgi:hypothetical protein